jgi:rhodanese-related sulfurtransferase
VVYKAFLALTLLAALAFLPSLIRRWQRPRRLQPHSLGTQLSHQAAPVVLDVRSPEEFIGELGHIRDAILMPLPELANRLGELAAYRQRSLVMV